MDAAQPIRILRFDREVNSAPHYVEYEVLLGAGTVLDALIAIQDFQDGSLTFRRSCRQGICGSCAMRINDRERLACMTPLSEVGGAGQSVTVAPLANMPIIKDLVVDMARFWAMYRAIMPYLRPDTSKPLPERENLVSQAETRKLHQFAACIQCGACFSACPIVATDHRYLGPAALSKAYRFTADPRDAAYKERLTLVSDTDGIWRCHTIFNCTEVCPVHVNPTEAIEHLKTLVIRDRLHLGAR